MSSITTGAIADVITNPLWVLKFAIQINNFLIILSLLKPEYSLNIYTIKM
jgi:hypothetical protein